MLHKPRIAGVQLSTIPGILLGALIFTASTPAAGQTETRSVSAPIAVRFEGALTDDVWRTARAVSEFVQREPTEGGAPSQRTEFRVAYDRTTVYVKVRAFDTDPDKIAGY